MKDKYLNIIWLSGIILSLTLSVGCKDSFLYTDNPNEETVNTFWSSKADVDKVMASAYSPLRANQYSYWGTYSGFQDINSMGDDVLTIPGEEATTWQVASFINDANNNDPATIFAKMYMTIYRANLLIANTPDVPNMEQNDKDSYIAEAKFLRGLAYFILASNFGDVPLRTKPAETIEEKYIPATPVDKIWGQVAHDFEAAAAELPVDRKSDDYGRATKGAALAYLGEAYLYQKKYDSSRITLLKLTQSPFHYELLKNYEDNFTKANKTNNPEAVYHLEYGPYGDQTSAWGFEQKNSGMYYYFPQIIGTPESGGWFKYIPSNYMVKQFLEEERPSGSDTKFDKRMYASFFWQYSKYGESDVTWYDGLSFKDLWESALGKISRFDAKYLDTTNYQFLIRKFTNSWETGVTDADNYWFSVPTAKNYVVMRYAEVLLNLAEAQIQTGHLQPALEHINEIRLRAGLSKKDLAADFNNDADELMEELKHQSLLEFFFEQKRWYGLKRWYDPSELKQLLIDHKKQGAENFSEKRYTFPIPSDEVRTNPAID